jgi:PKD repeat protein
MRATLLLFVMCTLIVRVSGQTPENADNTTSCNAAFSVNVDPFNPMVIHFQDQSSGQITLWQWSFGDGSTSTAQSPDHTYAAGGTYFVCLTVSSSDSVNICHDVLCVAITIHEPGECIADYQYATDPGNLFKIHFTDFSSGNINGWHWDFGDGTVSDDRNPTHVFPSYGKYKVCLMAYNVDSLSTCNDIKCDSIDVIPAPVCHAIFESQLDSLNPVPNTYRFTNRSAGDPNQYRWTFDDGSWYETRDVLHTFQSDGVHEVCLSIKKEVQGSIVCSDSICQSVSTAKYFDLGGHLFAGEYPINNPISTGDTGVANLFRVDGSKLIPCDTSRFTHLGYYAFPKKLNGQYIVKAALTPGSDHYYRYFPTYSGGPLTWSGSNPVDLTANSAYVADIHLALTVESMFGPGMISGRVLNANAKDDFKTIPFAEVILFDGQLNPLLFTFCSDSGQFELNNLPYGAYNVYVECPGKFSRMTAIWLDATVPVADSLRLEVFGHDVTSVQGLTVPSLIAGALFPNPAINEVNLALTLPADADIKFNVETLTGKTIWAETIRCHAGNHMITRKVTSIGPGMYLVVITTMDGSPLAVRKLLKY